MLKLMGDGSKHGTGGTVSAELWKRDHKADAVPDFEAGGFLRVDVLHALSLIEPSMCLSTADDVVEPSYARGGFPGTAGRERTCRRPPRARTWSPSSRRPTLTRSSATSRSTQNLPGVLATLRSALDDGHLVHARVLSGAYGPSDEHSLIVLGYTGNGFAFWDPDSSQAPRRSPGSVSCSSSTTAVEARPRGLTFRRPRTPRNCPSAAETTCTSPRPVNTATRCSG